MQKVNPYVIVIVVLLLVVAGLLYNQWGKKILPELSSTEKPSDTASPFGAQVSEGDIVIGNEDAPVTIVEYFSYFCGYCKLFKDQTEPQIIEDYISTGKAKLVLRAFPPFELGVAVLCANDQDKFFEYHDALFEDAAEIQEIDDLKTLAGTIGLDQAQFGECFDSQKYVTKAEQWYQQGQTDFENAGIPENQRGTPAFFINGEALVGAQPFEAFVEVIERKLTE